jgi:hypothetical protein
MNRIGSLLPLIFILAAVAVQPVAAQVGPVLISPRNGEMLQGVVDIRGSSDVAGFISMEVDFAYAGDSTGTWFQITTSEKPVNLDTVATWDTTTITDGDYILRLRVFLQDGSFLDKQVPGLRVRNYTPVETPTIALEPLQDTPLPDSTITTTPIPASTQLQRNPAVLTPVDISTSLAYGGLGSVLFLIALSIFLGSRRR